MKQRCALIPEPDIQVTNLSQGCRDEHDCISIMPRHSVTTHPARGWR